jgi:glycosyltransferase involved in cell wall biosynthesis
MSEIKVTILMPAYNAGKYIGDAIVSVLEQTFADFELVIVNDGSTDNTEEVIRSFIDTRIVLINQTHGGVSKALNTGLAAAKGEYIARFDADDICYKNRLQKQLVFLEMNPAYVIVGSDAEYMLENGEHLFNFSCIGHDDEELVAKLYFYCPFIHSSVMYRKDAVLKAGGYSVLAHNFEDYLLWTQLAKLGKLYNLPETIIRIRFNPASVTIDEKWRGNRFRELKRTIIKSGTISEDEGNELLAIIQRQNIRRIKEGSYYALCAKKFLTDNYQPAKAKKFAVQAIKANPRRLDNYALFLAVYLPEKIVQWLHHQSPNKL